MKFAHITIPKFLLTSGCAMSALTQTNMEGKNESNFGERTATWEEFGRRNHNHSSDNHLHPSQEITSLKTTQANTPATRVKYTT